MGQDGKPTPGTDEIEPMPAEYLEWYLCTEVFHCMPHELALEDWDTVLAHLTVHNVMHEYRNRPKGGTWKVSLDG